MEGDPFTLIEGMAIAGIGVGATKGYVYIRSEYPDAIEVMNAAIGIAREAGLLGASVLGSGRAFDMEVRVGAGAYVCGEETSLLNSLEGKRGVVRAKPPLPALEGLFGKPTVVNNVISLATVPVIFEKGAQFYRDFGLGRSRGTIPVQIAGNVRHGGLFETAFGMSLGDPRRGGRRRHRLGPAGAGGAGRRAARRLLPGLDVRHALRLRGVRRPGRADRPRRDRGLRRHASTWPGWRASPWSSAPSRAAASARPAGSARCAASRPSTGSAAATPRRSTLLTDLCETMKDGSLCALGGFTPYPVMSALRHFPEDFTASHKEAAA